MAKGGNGGNGGGGAISGNKRDNFLNGTENADLIEGKGGNDTLEGLGGYDTLNGGTGNDSLIGGLGDDLVDGGSGTDTVVFSGNRIDYSVTQIDANTVEITGPDGTDTVTNVETFQVADLTQSFADLLLPLYDLSLDSVSVNAASSDLDLGGDPFSGQGYGATLDIGFSISNLGVVGAGDATVTFYLSQDGTLSGDDLVLTSTTVAVAEGGTVAGNVTANVPADVLADDYTVIAVIGWGNPDEVSVNDTSTTSVMLSGGVIPGSVGDDLLTGTAYNDVAEGGEGNDTFVGSAGEDRFNGGNGTDTADYSGFGRGIELLGGFAAEIVQIGGSPKDALFDIERFIATDFDDSLNVMNSGLDWVDGGAGNDTLLGSSGDETLIGGAGDDRIQVLLGSDSVDGGTGLDTVVLTGNRNDFVVTQIDADTVEIAGPTYGSDVKIITGVEVFEFWDVSQNFAEVIVPLDPNVAVANVLLETAVVVEGDGLHVGWNVVSDGDVDADTSTTELVIASAPEMAQVIERFGVTETGVLTTSSTTSYSGVLDTTGFAPGTYYVAAIADSTDQLNESNETDNISGWTEVVIEAQHVDYSLDAVTVLPSSVLELSVDAPVYGGPAQTAAMLDLSLTVTNNSNVGPTEYEVTLFLSADNVLSVDDLQLYTGDPQGGTVTYTVDYGQTAEIAASAELSEFLPQGDYHVFAVINEDSASYDPNLPLDNPGDNILAAVAPITLVGGWTYGTEGNDLFTGDMYRETFEGNGGDDTLTGDVLGDVFYAGDGTDTLDLSDMQVGMMVSGEVGDGGIPPGYEPPAGNILTFEAFDPNTYDPNPLQGGAEDVERIIGTDFDDAMIIYYSSVHEMNGEAGNDTIIGSDANDTINGGTGDDALAGYFGDDLITTGDGFDLIIVDRETDGNGGYEGHGHDIVTDFDPLTDILLVEYEFGETYDPFGDLIQTAEGALLSPTSDSSVLLWGVDIADLNSMNLTGFEEGSSVAV